MKSIAVKTMTLSAMAGVALLLVACSTPAAAPTAAPPKATASVPSTATALATKPPEPTSAPSTNPTSTATAAPMKAVATTPVKSRVGLVTDQGGINDKSFNQAAWEGVQKAAQEFGFETQVIEATQSEDLAKNVDKLVADKCDVVVSVGYLMADVTAAKAVQYPNTRFAIIDVAYTPTKGATPCDESKKDCYTDGGLKNVTSLLFQEDEVGFLAGVVAGGMTQTGVVASVGSMEIPPVVRFITGYQNGALFARSNVKAINSYLGHFDRPDEGKAAAIKLIDQQADVVFGLGGTTGNGALLGAKEKGVMAIGVDMDQYLTLPEARTSLLTSAMKNVDVAVYSYLKAVNGHTAAAGVVTSNLRNGGVGLAPFHDWEDRVPASLKAKVKEATEGLLSGKIPTGYQP